jgi:hypothetical protein
LTSVYSPWPFHKWAVDIVGPFPLAPEQLMFLIVGVDYFTQWIEAEAVAKITAETVKKFYWKKIICRFGLPKCIVSDNGTQFASSAVVDFCKHRGIQKKFASGIHPQANGQAESANKVILNGIKKKLEDAKGLWAEQLHEVSTISKLFSLTLNTIKISYRHTYKRRAGQHKYRYYGLTTLTHIPQPWKHHSQWSMARLPCSLWK